MSARRELCESAKRGHLCIDDLCHAAAKRSAASASTTTTKWSASWSQRSAIIAEKNSKISATWAANIAIEGIPDSESRHERTRQG